MYIRTFIKFLIASILFAMVMTCSSCGRSRSGQRDQHACIYPLCPYKGIAVKDRLSAVMKYTGDSVMTDAVKVDMIHLKCPTWDYDRIDSSLNKHFTNN